MIVDADEFAGYFAASIHANDSSAHLFGQVDVVGLDGTIVG